MDHPDQTLEARWLAVLNREPAADGDFCYAVRSTGIYCRPTCPSRRPKRENVQFFDTPVQAEQAGFRPCLRCEPNSISNEQRVVSEVKRLLDTADAPLSLADLGQTVGMSPSHLQRLFKRVTGVSPKQYTASLQGARLKERLKRGDTVTEAVYAAGFGSARAAYDQAHRQLGMTPGAYRNGGTGETITYACADTPLGTMLLAATSAGICALRFGSEADLRADLTAEFPGARLVDDLSAMQPWVQAAQLHLSGHHPALDLPLDISATAFQHRVWAALQSIPYGEVRSYSQVAEMIGQPTAVRAVARACAANPVALAIPCHRVVRSDGALSGFRWGADRKQELLSQEQRSAACTPGIKSCARLSASEGPGL